MAFTNPPGGPDYQGPYSVELAEGAGVNHLPSSVQIDGLTVKVTHGRLIQTMGGIQFFSREQPFSWGYKYIRCIRDSAGKLLWVNSSCKDEIIQ